MNKMRYICAAFCLVFVGTVSVFAQGNRIAYNNQALFLSGANLAWVSFARDIGPATTNLDSFANTFLQIHDHGGNAVRWWLHTNGTSTPEFDAAGLVAGPGQGTIQDLKNVLDLAWEREVGVILCLWSFDMLRSSNSADVLNRNKLLLNDTTYTHAYINNCLIPMVDSLKSHPAIIAWEIFNEPEGMSTELGWGDIQHVPMSAIQRFINLSAGAIHRTDSTAQVTSGAWSFLALTDVATTSVAKAGTMPSRQSPAEQQLLAASFNQKYRMSLSTDEVMRYLDRLANVTNFNYYEDSRLIYFGGDPDGTLDFYSVHYYSGIVPSNPTSISPFHHPKDYWGLTKPLVVAEFALQSTYGVPKAALYDTLYQMGYAGALAWSWTDINFSSHVDMLSSMQFLFDSYRPDVDVNGISGDWPQVAITSPAADTTFAEDAEVTIEATASDADGSVVLVEFFANDTLKIGERNAEPFSITWTNIAPGIYRLTAIATDNQGHRRTSDEVRIQVGSPAIVRLEAESAARAGDVQNLLVRRNTTASNGSYVEMRTQSGTITWQIPAVPAAGSYEIVFGYRLSFDTPKTQYINVNGTRVAEVVFNGSMNTWLEKKLTVNLVQGSNTIQMELFWGWMDIDYLGVPSIVTAVKGTFEAPASYFLAQNYPNPFNPTTNIGYALAKPEHVKLIVYDIQGRQVKVLVDEIQNAGPYQIAFDGGNLATGLYFYRLQAGAFIQKKRMLLLK